MPSKRTTLRVGTRSSPLALVQTRATIARFRDMLPDIDFLEVALSSPGDRDLRSDLRESPPDFFTRDLDEQLLAGRIDCAIHSAKDLPTPMPSGVDWAWLPWREDPRDVLVLPEGKSFTHVPPSPRLGISSARREDYCRSRFPGCRMLPLRGTIEQRLKQLDDGHYDVVVMAAAALNRLGLAHRISEWIPLDTLGTPEGQGVLALTFREGDERFLRLRGLFVKAVRFVGAGCGTEACSLAGVRALQTAEVCLHDRLLDPRLLDHLPRAALRLDAGKRCGREGSRKQAEITQLILDHQRRGLRVVRLKGGDPGIFGRLAEETAALEAHHLPFTVIPGISSISAASAASGILLTRRGESRGFCAITPRLEGGRIAPVNAAERARLPVVLLMALSTADRVVADLLAEGLPSATPATAVINAGTPEQTEIRSTLERLISDLGTLPVHGGEIGPGLLIVGECARRAFRRSGALRGARVLVTASDALQEKASLRITDLGGIPLPLPLIALTLDPSAVERLRNTSGYDWIVLTSPSAVDCFLEAISKAAADIRRLPRLMVCGPGTAQRLREARLQPDLEPASGFGAEGLLASAKEALRPGDRVLRLRSDKAGDDLGSALSAMGAQVEDVVLYRNVPVRHDHLPPFESVFFASGSAVEAFLDQFGPSPLQGRTIVAIGRPTEAVLQRHGLHADIVPPEPTAELAVEALALDRLRRDVLNLEENP